jgi:hypothetical protein
MEREVKADTESRELVSRETTVKATDKTTVLGTASLLAGAIVQMTTGDFSLGVQGKHLVAGDMETDVTGKQQSLSEKSWLRKLASCARVSQEQGRKLSRR